MPLLLSLLPHIRHTNKESWIPLLLILWESLTIQSTCQIITLDPPSNHKNFKLVSFPRPLDTFLDHLWRFSLISPRKHHRVSNKPIKPSWCLWDYQSQYPHIINLKVLLGAGVGNWSYLCGVKFTVGLMGGTERL